MLIRRKPVTALLLFVTVFATIIGAFEITATASVLELLARREVI
jgi:hypothetical protein